MKQNKEIITAFAQQAHYFASLDPNGQLRVFDTDDGKCFISFKSLENTQKKDCLLKSKKTVLSWSNFAKDESETALMLFIGSSYGVEAVDVHRGEIAWRAPLQHGVADVTAVDDGLLFASLRERSGGRLEVKGGTLTQSFKIGKHKVKLLIPVPNSLEKMIVAGSHLVLWNVMKEKSVIKYSGHTSEVSVMCTSPCGRYVVTGCKNERQLALWSTELSHQDAIKLLPMDQPPSNLSIAPLQDDAFVVCALSAHGLISVWKCEVKLEGDWNPVLWAQLKPSQQCQQPQTTQCEILAAHIEVLAEEVIVHVVRETKALPVFERYVLPEVDREQPYIKTLSEPTLPKFFDTQDPKSNSEPRKRRKQEVITIGADNDGEAMQITHLNPKQRPSRAPSDLTGDANVPQTTTADLTLGERIALLEQKMEGTSNVTSEEKNSFLSPSSAVVLVKQVNQSGDIELFLRLTQMPRDLIIRTVKCLDATEASKFLQICIDRMKLRPNTAIPVIWWIRGLIKIHASSLMSSSSTHQQLTYIHQMIEGRLATFDALVAMSGRLDLLLTQVDLHAKAKEKMKIDNDAQVTVDVHMSDDEESAFEEVDYENE